MSLCHEKSQFPISIPLAGWQETLRSPTSRLAGDQKVSCQPAGRRHFLIVIVVAENIIDVNVTGVVQNLKAGNTLMCLSIGTPKNN